MEKLVDLLKDASFARGAYGPEQMPVKYQVMIWLHFFGQEGMTIDPQRTDLHTCIGLCEQSRKRVTAAFNHIRHDWIHWPNEEERNAIAKLIEQESSYQMLWESWVALYQNWVQSRAILTKQTTMVGSTHIPSLVMLFLKFDEKIKCSDL